MPIQLPALTGHRDGLWWAGLDPLDRVPRPPLGGDADADVAIVGAGYTGLWTAYYQTMLSYCASSRAAARRALPV